ncbi:MAG: prepilin-type N-terminal cleavage/methylation domain-containing protein [Erysipelotrichaceae bacterium]
MIKVIKSEKGFTLMETVIVMGVMTIFLTVLTNILLVAINISNKLDTNLSDKTSTSIAYNHISTVVKANDSYDTGNAVSSISVYSDPLTGVDVLKIKNKPSNYNGDVLFYYLDKNKKTAFFYADTFGTGRLIKDSDRSLVLAENVHRLSFEITDKNVLLITIETYIDPKATDLENEKNLNKMERKLTLKAAQ